MQNVFNKENIQAITFVPAVSAMIVRNTDCQVYEALGTAQAMFEMINYIDQPHFGDLVNAGYSEMDMSFTNENGEQFPVDLGATDCMALIRKAGLVGDDGQPTESLIKLTLEKSRYMPVKAGNKIERRFKRKSSKLVKFAIQAMESVEFNVDEMMLKIAEHIFKNDEFNGVKIDKSEIWVLRACRELVNDGNEALNAEWKPDSRFRLYQAACHSPNGQTSDMARSLYNFVGVPTNYNIDSAIKVLKDEMADMIKGDVDTLCNHVMTNGSVRTIQEKLACDVDESLKAEFPMSAKIKKPWSFVKACFILAELLKGNRPYIGMAFGLDAKCSGIQLGALMCGDNALAAACGFAEIESWDAYQLCMKRFEGMGYDINRDTMKKPFMGVFYGQGMLAFANPKNYKGNKGATGKAANSAELWAFVSSMGCDILADDIIMANTFMLDPQMVANARVFHGTVEDSFGEMKKVRKMFKNAHSYWDEDAGMRVFMTRDDVSVGHFMPDGARICTNERVSKNVLGGIVDSLANTDYDVNVNGYTYEKYKVKTNMIDVNRQMRTGFVNLIQGTDALTARLIIANLFEDGVKHIVSVHDCFRVNICDMIDGKLHEAIKLAYAQMFTDIDVKWFVQKVDGINPKDILANYFHGVKAVRKEEDKGRPVKEFHQFIGKIRKFQTVKGLPIVGLIDKLENKLDNTGCAYFFAK